MKYLLTYNQSNAMKKKNFVFAIILLSIACNPHEEDDNSKFDKGAWYVKNCSDQYILLKVDRFSILYPYYLDQIIVPNDSILIFVEHFYQTVSTVPCNFDGILYPWKRNYLDQPNWYIEALSEKSILLKTWNYLEKNQPDKHFFRESSWNYYERPKKNGYINATWTFEIWPEDLITEDNDSF